MKTPFERSKHSVLVALTFGLCLVTASCAARAPQTQVADRPIRVGSNILDAQIVERVAPVYPSEARANRIQGVVIMEVVIDTEGAVSSVRTLEGDPLLSVSAEEAVSQWAYRPFLLNGQPTEVMGTIEANFSLN